MILGGLKLGRFALTKHHSLKSAIPHKPVGRDLYSNWIVGKIFASPEDCYAFVDHRDFEEFGKRSHVLDHSLTSFGKALKYALVGHEIVDLACGVGAKTIKTLALDFEASGYLGIDLRANPRVNTFDAFKEEYIRQDMLQYVSALPDNSSIFHIAGAEEDTDDPSIYMRALLKEIFRATKKGGIFIKGAYNSLPNPVEYGFAPLEEADNHEEEAHIYIKP